MNIDSIKINNKEIKLFKNKRTDFIMNIKELLNLGIINIDKPIGPTSFGVSSYVREKLKLKKTSHLGTLDPKVTGVLPITLGRACRLSGFFISHKKSYVGILHTHKENELKRLQGIINKNFIGKIKQIPPHKSAVKREIREREVYSWKLLEESESKKDFLFCCEVQGGTYIRKLCSDLGDVIGGAHMSELRRTKAGIFDEEKMYTIDEFSKAVELYEQGKEEELVEMIIPAEQAIKKIMQVIKVNEKLIKTILTGKPLFLDDIKNTSEFIKININDFFALFLKEKFIGVYKKVSESNLIAKPEFVCN